MSESIYNFSAKGRIPTRPLSYDNKDLALAKEILIDYKNFKLYISYEDSETQEIKFADATASIGPEQLKIMLGENPDIIPSVKIPEYDENGNIKYDENGNVITTDKDVGKTLNDLLDSYSKLSEKVDGLTTNDIAQAEDKQYISASDRANWNSKTTTSISNLEVVIKPESEEAWTSTEDYYTKDITVEEILESDYPIIGISLSEAYSTAVEELNNYSYIYKILTFDTFIRVFATKPTVVTLNLVIKVDRTLETSIESINNSNSNTDVFLVASEEESE